MRYLLLILPLLAACEPPMTEATKAYHKMRFDSEVRSRENCLKAGGIVVESGWSLLIKGCKAPLPDKTGGK